MMIPDVKNKETEIEGMKIEEVNSAKYLRTIMNADNLIEEEIKERIAAGNRSFFANEKIFQSKLITRKTKVRLYHTVIRSECWVLTENIKQKLLVFERRLLRRIFCPTQKTNGEWRQKNKQGAGKPD